MRHKLTLLASVVAVVASLCGAVWTHADATAKLALQHSEVQAQQVIQEAKTKATGVKAAEQSQVEISHLEAACQNGLAAYDQLPPYQKAKAVMPNCSVALQ